MSDSGTAGQPPAVDYPGWVEDIVGMLAPFRSNMMWRLDLGNYDQVTANGTLINSLISSQQMPPLPFPPLSDTQITTFDNWVNQGYPMHRSPPAPAQSPVAATATPAGVAAPPTTGAPTTLAGNQQTRRLRYR